MSETQVWIVIGGFFTIFLGHVGLVLRVLRSDIARITDRLDRLDRGVQRLVESFAR